MIGSSTEKESDSFESYIFSSDDEEEEKQP